MSERTDLVVNHGGSYRLGQTWGRRGMKDWQPIETAPKDASQVLLWDGVAVSIGYRCNGHTKPYHATVRGEDANWDDYGGDPILSPTHWMPLPDPPKDAA
jgi:hypothetical protein